MNRFLTKQEILNIHRILIKKFGGIDGIRTEESLESAIFRPQSGYYSNIYEEAAALLESLLINHPFLDGNKRTAFAAAHIFLEINGYTISADTDTIYNLIMKWLAMTQVIRFNEMVQDLRNITLKKPNQ